MVVLEQTLTVVLGLNLPSFPDLRDTMHRGLLPKYLLVWSKQADGAIYASQHTSCVDTTASFPQFWHTASKQTAELWSTGLQASG